MTKFSQGYRVGIKSDVPSIMDYVQQACLHHTYSTPGSMKFYDDLELAWVLTHWQVEIESLPAVADDITISTWSAGFKGFFGERGFIVNDQNGNIHLNANSNWMLVNRKNLKPVRPTDEISQKYGGAMPLLIPKDFSIPKVQEFDFFSSKHYTVTMRDIDSNNHVNNIAYLTWAWDFFEDGIVPTTLKVAYKKEIRLHDEVEIKLYKSETNGFFIEIENGGKISAEIYLSWKKEDGEN